MGFKSGKDNPNFGKFGNDHPMGGTKLSKETKMKISKSRTGLRYPMFSNRDEKHHGWKGDYVGYNSLHRWAKRRIQKPEFCAMCNKTHPVDLANISGEYRRDITDWWWLCRLCHMVSDGRLENLIEKRRLRHKKLK